ncbi:MAG TPA: DUF1269 domain-containing protein [Thermomicrobiales bacterium]|nr:DUF1269 domain-containing protein [Thermomicrobiales bacterium]
MAETNIVVVTFEDESKTYQAFSEIKRAAAQGELKIHGLTIMHRTLEGRFEVRDAAMRNYGGSITGGLIGSLVGIMGGPLGVLVGWGAGALIGGIRDANEIMSDRTLFQRLTEDMSVGSTALVGEIEEHDTSVVNQIIRKLGGEVLRRPTAEVEADIKAAEHARDAASREALRVLNEDSERRGLFGRREDDVTKG